MRSFLVVSSILIGASAAPAPSRVQHAKRQASSPYPASVSLVANVTDPSISRDSCGSALIGGRALWTCRDTEAFDASTGQAVLPVYVNSASWTDFNSDGTPAIITDGPVGDASSGTNPILEMYGGNPTSYPVFFPIQDDECPDNGFCSDGSRWAIWPNSPPMVATVSGNATSAYTWIPKAQITGLTALIPEPAYTLYELTYLSGTPDPDTLPTVSVVNEEFWAEGQIGYGSYGNVVVNGTAYLFGQLGSGATALATVAAGSVTDVSQYSYLVNGTWTNVPPSINDTSAGIANAGAGGQGTFYYSEYFSLYIWIGQQAISVSADFYLTYATSPEGPWAEPYLIYSGPNGDNPIGAYSLQAHPALLSSPTQNGIYLTYTQQWNTTTYGGYVTPLLYVAWE